VEKRCVAINPPRSSATSESRGCGELPERGRFVALEEDLPGRAVEEEARVLLADVVEDEERLAVRIAERGVGQLDRRDPAIELGLGRRLVGRGALRQQLDELRLLVQ
jgi:hypothetical protein